MIKIYSASAKTFENNGLGTIEPISCLETKKKSLEGWSLDVVAPAQHSDILVKDNIVVADTKEKGPQAFRINNPIKSDRRISFTADHVAFDAKDYLLADVRPEGKSPKFFLDWCNSRTDSPSPFTIGGDAEGVGTYYFVRKNLLDAFSQAEITFPGLVFDFDNFIVKANKESSVGSDNGFSVVYGVNSQGVKVTENWDDVCTKVLPLGSNDLQLPEVYVSSSVQYSKPYSKVASFEVPDKSESGDTYSDADKIAILRGKAKEYLEENKAPKIAYEIKSDVPQDLSINDVVHIKHPLIDIKTNVQAYTYDCISKRVKSLTFGNYDNSVKSLFQNSIASSSEKTATANVDTHLNAYDQQMQSLVKTVVNALGLYPIKVLQTNGSYKFYMADKPTIEASKTIWTLVDNALVVSTDGGKSYNVGIDANGNIIAKILSVIGLNADWINVGTIKAVDIVGCTINCGNGKFIVDAYGNLIANAGTLSDITINNGTIITKGPDFYTKISDGTINLYTGDSSPLLSVRSFPDEGILDIYNRAQNRNTRISSNQVYIYDTNSKKSVIVSPDGIQFNKPDGQGGANAHWIYQN